MSLAYTRAARVLSRWVQLHCCEPRGACPPHKRGQDPPPATRVSGTNRRRKSPPELPTRALKRGMMPCEPPAQLKPRSREVEREPPAADLNQLTPAQNSRVDSADPRHFNSRKAEEDASHPGQNIPLSQTRRGGRSSSCVPTRGGARGPCQATTRQGQSPTLTLGRARILQKGHDRSDSALTPQLRVKNTCLHAKWGCVMAVLGFKMYCFCILRPFTKDLYRGSMWTLPLGIGSPRYLRGKGCGEGCLGPLLGDRDGCT